jgi:hypothetical protein
MCGYGCVTETRRSNAPFNDNYVITLTWFFYLTPAEDQILSSRGTVLYFPLRFLDVKNFFRQITNKHSHIYKHYLYPPLEKRYLYPPLVSASRETSS